MTTIDRETQAEGTTEFPDVQSRINALKELLTQGKIEEVRQALQEIEGMELSRIWDKADTGLQIFSQTVDPENVHDIFSKLVDQEMGHRNFKIYEQSRMSAKM